MRSFDEINEKSEAMAYGGPSTQHDGLRLKGFEKKMVGRLAHGVVDFSLVFGGAWSAFWQPTLADRVMGVDGQTMLPSKNPKSPKDDSDGVLPSVVYVQNATTSHHTHHPSHPSPITSHIARKGRRRMKASFHLPP
jgi:hypothetical protein